MIAWVVFTFLGLGFTTTMVQTLTDENLNVLAALRVCCPTLCGVADAKEMSTGELPTKGYQAKRRHRPSNAAAVATANEQLKLGHTSVMDTQARAIEPSGVGSASFNTKLFQIPPGVQTAGATPAAPFAPESVSLANVSSATSATAAVARWRPPRMRLVSAPHRMRAPEELRAAQSSPAPPQITTKR